MYTLNSGHRQNGIEKSLPGEVGIPLLHGPITESERTLNDAKLESRAKEETERDYKNRQLKLAQSANIATWANIIFTISLAVFTWLGVTASRQNARSAQDAADAAREAARLASAALAETQANNVRQANLAEQARKDAKTAAEIANHQSKAALQATADNFRQEQRPWIGLGDKSEFTIIAAKRPIYWNIEFVNYGKSPAFDWSVHTHLYPDERHITIKDIRQDIRSLDVSAGSGASSVMWPGTSGFNTDRSKSYLDTQTFGDITSKRIKLIIGGRLSYTDIDRNIHFFSFCREYLPDLLPGAGNLLTCPDVPDQTN